MITLMGLFVGFVVVNMGGKDPAEQLEKQAKRFQVIVDMASDMAILNQRQLGLRVEEDDNSFYFMYLDEEQRWRKLEGEKAFEETQLEEPFTLELQLDGLPWQDDEDLFDDEIFDEELSLSDEGVQIGKEEDKPLPPPQILLFSSGEVTPFSMILKYEPDFGDDPVTYFRVNGVNDTPLQLEGPLDIL